MNKPQIRKIIHIDMDYFYAQVEEREDASLKNQPIAVGGSGARGVIATCNYIARKFRVHSALSTRKALQRCPKLVIVQPRMALYKQVSQDIHRIFKRFSQQIEPLSLDEAYLDVSGNSNASQTARDICQAIYDELALTASSGVAANKFLAKIASNVNKPNGHFVIRPQQTAAFLATLSVKELPGVGPVTYQKLQTLAIQTCSDLQQYSLAQLQNQFGKFGKRLHELARGIDHSPVQHDTQRKSISVETTFGQDLDQYAASQEITVLMEQLSIRLHNAKARYPHLGQTKALVLKLKCYDFQLTTCEAQYHELKADIYQLLLSKAYARHGKKIRLLGLGVRLSDNSEQQTQMVLF